MLYDKVVYRQEVCFNEVLLLGMLVSYGCWCSSLGMEPSKAVFRLWTMCSFAAVSDLFLESCWSTEVKISAPAGKNTSNCHVGWGCLAFDGFSERQISVTVATAVKNISKYK